eukprot:7783612-Alexandrium_andersonii.AAC.1
MLKFRGRGVRFTTGKSGIDGRTPVTFASRTAIGYSRPGPNMSARLLLKGFVTALPRQPSLRPV